MSHHKRCDIIFTFGELSVEKFLDKSLDFNQK